MGREEGERSPPRRAKEFDERRLERFLIALCAGFGDVGWDAQHRGLSEIERRADLQLIRPITDAQARFDVTKVAVDAQGCRGEYICLFARKQLFLQEFADVERRAVKRNVA